jgi:hypothetical protein
MKQKVIEFFQNLPEEKTEQFNKAFELYRQSSGKNASVERSYNASGYSAHILKNLLYDLQALHGIKDVEKVAVIESKLSVTKSELPDYILAFSEEELRAWFHTVAGESSLTAHEVIKIANTEGKTEIVAILTEELGKISLNDNASDLESDFIVPMNPSLGEADPTDFLKKEADIQLQPIREEFPFLNEANCPDELKILVSDKITAWKKYVDVQKDIANAEAGLNNLTAEQLEKLAKVAIEAFEENKRIYDELNVYKDTGKVLGVHPIFKKLQMSREVEAMTNDELIKYKSASAKYFSDNKKGLEKAKKNKDEAKSSEIQNRVAERKDKLFLVNKKLGV